MECVFLGVDELGEAVAAGNLSFFAVVDFDWLMSIVTSDALFG
jgi:hypothetical protein